MELHQRVRDRIAEIVRSRPLDGFFTHDKVEGEEVNLPDLDSWIQAVIDGGPLDFRGVDLVAELFGVEVQTLLHMTEGNAYILTDVDGLTTPLRKKGLILWTSGCHFEAVVAQVQKGVE